MSIFIYFVSAFVLLRCCVSPNYRAKTQDRWRRTPTHRVIYEVGGGIIGLITIGAIIVLIIRSQQ
jgi:hypothetical protein